MTCLLIRENQGFGAPKGTETLPGARGKAKTHLKNTCKIMEQEEHRQISPRWSWTTTHMGNSRSNLLSTYTVEDQRDEMHGDRRTLELGSRSGRSRNTMT
jgi:hypothetical protein